MQKLKFQKHYIRLYLERGLKMCKSCARLCIKYIWFDYSATGILLQEIIAICSKNIWHTETLEWRVLNGIVHGTDYDTRVWKVWTSLRSSGPQLRLHRLSCTWLQSSPSTYSYHKVGPLVDLFWSHASRRLVAISIRKFSLKDDSLLGCDPYTSVVHLWQTV